MEIKNKPEAKDKVFDLSKFEDGNEIAKPENNSESKDKEYGYLLRLNILTFSYEKLEEL